MLDIQYISIENLLLCKLHICKLSVLDVISWVEMDVKVCWIHMGTVVVSPTRNPPSSSNPRTSILLKTFQHSFLYRIEDYLSRIQNEVYSELIKSVVGTTRHAVQTYNITNNHIFVQKKRKLYRIYIYILLSYIYVCGVYHR